MFPHMQLSIVNCHQHTETSDFLGSLRPTPADLAAKGKLFQWVDGPLVTALKKGHYFMLDEINLAEDSILERLNSVFESGRSLTLPEKGSKRIEVCKIAGAFLLSGSISWTSIFPRSPDKDVKSNRRQLAPQLLSVGPQRSSGEDGCVFFSWQPGG